MTQRFRLPKKSIALGLTALILVSTASALDARPRRGDRYYRYQTIERFDDDDDYEYRRNRRKQYTNIGLPSTSVESNI